MQADTWAAMWGPHYPERSMKLNAFFLPETVFLFFISYKVDLIEAYQYVRKYIVQEIDINCMTGREVGDTPMYIFPLISKTTEHGRGCLFLTIGCKGFRIQRGLRAGLLYNRARLGSLSLER